MDAYLTAAGDLCIPVDSDPRFHYWLPGGQSIQQTLAELGATRATLDRYDLTVLLLDPRDTDW